jgi:hypothetical protein
MQLYIGFLFQELYMFRAFTMPIIRSNITAKAAVGITYCLCSNVTPEGGHGERPKHVEFLIEFLK